MALMMIYKYDKLVIWFALCLGGGMREVRA